MSPLTRATLDRLASSEGGEHVSIYLPTVRAGDQIEQNKIRFKNALRSAKKELQELGQRRSISDEQLAPAQALSQDHGFWQNQYEGLAVLLAEGTFETIRLPQRVPERSVVSDRFHLKPLLPYATGQVHYYILALEREGVRMFRGGRHGVEQLPLTGSSNSLSEFLQWDDPETQLQWHTQTGSLTMGGRSSMFHGHGAGSEGEVNTEQLERFLGALDNAVYQLLAGDEQPPLTVVGGEELIGHYRKVNRYPNLVPGELEHVPSQLEPDELHRMTWPLVEPRFQEKIEAARQRFLGVQDDERIASDVRRVLRAAQAGAVQLLFVPSDAQRWGRFDPDSGEVEEHDARQPGDDDLFDLAAVRSLRNGAEVYVVDQEEMPGDGDSAAVLRYAVPEA